jgi:hypothetical protein
MTRKVSFLSWWRSFLSFHGGFIFSPCHGGDLSLGGDLSCTSIAEILMISTERGLILYPGWRSFLSSSCEDISRYFPCSRSFLFFLRWSSSINFSRRISFQSPFGTGIFFILFTARSFPFSSVLQEFPTYLFADHSLFLRRDAHIPDIISVQPSCLTDSMCNEHNGLRAAGLP